MAARWALFGITVLFTLLLLMPSSARPIQRFLTWNASPETGMSEGAALERDALLAEVAALRDLKTQLPRRELSYLKTFVYSRYPFNFKQELLVGAGKVDGVAEGAAVALPVSSSSETLFLLGRVREAWKQSATVQTVFDSRFELPVRIGERGVNALLRGGSEPTLTLIPKQARLNDGDAVYTAAPGTPYGLALGTLTNLRMSSNQLFTEGTLALHYDLNSIRAVLISREAERHDVP